MDNNTLTIVSGVLGSGGVSGAVWQFLQFRSARRDYETRLAAIEGRMMKAEGAITALNGRVDDVEAVPVARIDKIEKEIRDMVAIQDQAARWSEEDRREVKRKFQLLTQAFDDFRETVAALVARPQKT